MPDTTPPRPDSAPDATLASDAQDLLQQRLRAATVGEYDIFGKLGSGGMASVFLAHDLALDRRVAIKLMSPDMVYGAGLVERFRQEARTAAALSHPNIIPIYAVRETDGLLYFVMKVVDGTSLDAVLGEAGPLPIPMVRAILSQVGGALGYAHRHGVVHRDVKPANILLDEEGWVVVTDFGIAKVMDASSLTLTGTAVGTPTYMSPEQCAGDEISGASDQYSLGVVAYEMITGRPPFTDKSIPALLLGHTARQPPAITQLRPDCPQSLRLAVERMLAKDPAERFESVEAAIAAAEAGPLAPDDPTRNTMVALARNGSTRQFIAQVRTPRSPVPLLRRARTDPATPTEASSRRSGMLVVAGLATGIVLATMVSMLLLRDRAPMVSDDSPATVQQVATPAPAGDPPLPGPVEPAPRAPQQTAAIVPSGAPALPLPTAPAPSSGSGRDPSGAGQTRTAPATRPPESAVATRNQPAPTEPATVVASPSPPADSSSPPPATALAPPPVADPRTEIEAVIRDYASALESGQIEHAVRIFPSMPPGQRGGLEAFYRDGGSMKTHWRIGDLVVSGSTATLRISGTNTVTTSRSSATATPVSLRASLQRGTDGWRLVALSN